MQIIKFIHDWSSFSYSKLKHALNLLQNWKFLHGLPTYPNYPLWNRSYLKFHWHKIVDILILFDKLCQIFKLHSEANPEEQDVFVKHKCARLWPIPKKAKITKSERQISCHQKWTCAIWKLFSKNWSNVKVKRGSSYI